MIDAVRVVASLRSAYVVFEIWHRRRTGSWWCTVLTPKSRPRARTRSMLMRMRVGDICNKISGFIIPNDPVRPVPLAKRMSPQIIITFSPFWLRIVVRTLFLAFSRARGFHVNGSSVARSCCIEDRAFPCHFLFFEESIHVTILRVAILNELCGFVHFFLFLLFLFSSLAHGIVCWELIIRIRGRWSPSPSLPFLSH